MSISSYIPCLQLVDVVKVAQSGCYGFLEDNIQIARILPGLLVLYLRGESKQYYQLYKLIIVQCHVYKDSPRLC